MTVYIVTGDGPRCGSSMMMQALKAGGMKVIFDESEEAMVALQSTDDYNPNPGGRFEVNFKKEEFFCGFPDPNIFGGAAFKMFPSPWSPLPEIVAGDYRIVWIHRPAIERWGSFRKAHERKPLVWMTDPEENDWQKNIRDTKAQETLGILKMRRDVRLIEFDYQKIVWCPSVCFGEMAAAGWPINPDEAATIPDRTLKRF